MDLIQDNIFYKKLDQLLKKKRVIVSVIGLGYVGLPLALTFAKKGIKVIGFDVNKKVISNINSGKSYIHHINSETVLDARKKDLIEATEDFSRISEVDVIIICVPTPLNKYREPDLSYIKSTISSIAKYLKKGQIISLESTTYPGTSEEVLKPTIENEGFKIGEDFFLVYSPEREDPGNKIFSTQNIPKLVGGISPQCSKLGELLYLQIIEKVILLSSTKAAELTKLIENIHRSVNIGLMNELKPLADCLGIDLYEVIRAAATKPFGFTPYYPGPGIGGHCIPIDPFYLTWKAKEYGMHTRFIELAGEINASMPEYVINKTTEVLNTNLKPVKSSKILILGLAYKKNVDDVRESPSINLIQLLIEKGAIVEYSDPYIKRFPITRRYNINLESIKLTKKNISLYDCVILATDHDDFDYDLIQKHSKILIDTRGRFAIDKNILRG